MFGLRGFQGLFRNTNAYRDYDDPQISREFSTFFCFNYWASNFLNHHYYATPFESLVTGYDAVKNNIYQTSQRQHADNLALLFAKNIIEEQRREDINKAMELGNAFDISLPAVLTVALLESSNFEDLLRNVIQIRREAKHFRKKMRKLDDSQATAGEIIDAVADLKQEAYGLRRFLNYVQLGASYVVVSVGLPLSSLLPPKKNFVKRLSQSTPRAAGLSGKITEVFRNSGWKVDGRDVLECIRTFAEQVGVRR